MSFRKITPILLLFLTIHASLFAAAKNSEKDDETTDYERYIANLPVYEEPIKLPKEQMPLTPLFTWVPSSHVKGLNIVGLVPSVNIGVGRVSFESTKNNSTLFEYNWGYRVFSWFNLAFSYQNQRMEFHNHIETIWVLGMKRFKDESAFALHSLLFKGYLESPQVLKADRFFVVPYFALGAGPGWVQKGILGATIRTWEGDLGIRFGAIHPFSFLSLMTGIKYIQWMGLGHSVVQYLGLRLNF
jgi:hypothetical protein